MLRNERENNFILITGPSWTVSAKVPDSLCVCLCVFVSACVHTLKQIPLSPLLLPLGCYCMWHDVAQRETAIKTDKIKTKKKTLKLNE